MFRQNDIADAFFDTFDRSAVEKFRDFVSFNNDVEKWIIAADFVIADDTRVNDSMAFSIFAIRDPHDLKRKTESGLPRDLKKSKFLSDEAEGTLRDESSFHIIVSLNKARELFWDGPGQDQVAIAREHVKLTLEALQARENAPDRSVRRYRKLNHEAKAGNFKKDLLADIWLLGVFYACLSVALCRERKQALIGWFPDRDKMTEWCDAVWEDYAYWGLGALCDHLDVDMRPTEITIGRPERPSGPLWYDYMVRHPDWLAGTVAAWDRLSNEVPDHHPKYQQIVSRILADSPNTVLLQFDIAGGYAQFRRIGVFASSPDDRSDGSLDPVDGSGDVG